MPIDGAAGLPDDDRHRWDRRYAQRGPVPTPDIGPPAVFESYSDEFPTAGRALDLACGQGVTAVWLARRGLDVRGVDISPVAVRHARDLAERAGVADHCRFDVADLDAGLPPGPSVAAVVCHRFRARHLDRQIVDRLQAGGVLAVSVLSEVDAAPGPFRAAPGELTRAFAGLDLIAAGEGGGQAWLLARRR